MFWTKIVDKIKTKRFIFSSFFLKLCYLWDKVEKHCRSRPQIKICCMHIACWIPESTNTHSEHVLLLFHCNSGCMNMPQCCVARVVPLLLFIDMNRKRYRHLTKFSTHHSVLQAVEILLQKEKYNSLALYQCVCLRHLWI
jgi:hypothetical protein